MVNCSHADHPVEPLNMAPLPGRANPLPRSLLPPLPVGLRPCRRIYQQIVRPRGIVQRNSHQSAVRIYFRNETRFYDESEQRTQQFDEPEIWHTARRHGAPPLRPRRV